MPKSPLVDFCETRSPCLSISGSVEDPTMQIELPAFFVWLWEPYHSLWVTGASKDDKTVINLILWMFGGGTTEIEISRTTIINFLLQCWKWRFYLESIRWLKNQYPIEYDISEADLYCALTWAIQSSWWECQYGSQLFFWCWPSLWMK